MVESYNKNLLMQQLEKNMKDIEYLMKQLEKNMEELKLINNKIDDRINTDEKSYDLNYKIDLINNANTIWYMNGNKKDSDDLNNWYKWKKNGFVLTWNHDNKNNNIYKTLKINDIICWHIVGGGYNSILKVNGPIHNITDNELDLIRNESDKIEWKENMKKYNYKQIVIPVEFIESTDNKYIKYNINGYNINGYNKNNWIHGFRGSIPIKIKNINWKNQVIDMLQYMHIINHKLNLN